MINALQTRAEFANVHAVSVSFPQLVARRVLTTLLACGLALAAAGRAGAQVQETRMSGILNPDRTKAADLGGKTFTSGASAGSKRANVRTYAFGRSSVFGGADGAYRARDFADPGSFRTGGYATRADRAGQANGFAAAGRGFATKALPVDDAREANKSLDGVRRYVPGDRSLVVRGKRQDDLDDLYHQKNLSIDQVRELLNKPGSGTDAPTQSVNATPVLRALPVTAPAPR